MSEDPLFRRLREEWQPDRVDAAAFSAGLRSRLRRRVATAAALVAAPIVAWMAWPNPAPAPVALEVEPVAAPSTPPPARVIEGVATAADGSPLVGAMVSAGSESTVTDERGRFVISALPGQTVSVTAEGWSTAWARVTDDHPLTIAALPSRSLGVLPATKGGTLVGPDGFTLKLPPNGVETPSGEPYTGDVHVRWTLLRRPEDMAAAPGDLATVVNGAEVPLESFGMAEVVLTDPEGGVLVLASPAEIRVPLSDAHPFAEGQEVGLYSYDELAGLWSDEGRGVVQDGKMVAQVRHFSWWNCDAPIFDTGCVCGKVRLLDRKIPLKLRAFGEKFLTNASTVSNPDDGAFCVDSKPSSPVHLAVLQRSGDLCIRGESPSVVASGPGTSKVLDTRKCARVDFDAIADACPVAKPVPAPPPVTWPGAVPRLEQKISESAAEVDGTVTVAQEAPKPENYLHVTVWSAPDEVPIDEIGWACGDLDWTRSQRAPVVAGGVWIPVEPDQACEILVGDERFGFFTVEGNTDVFCNREIGAKCRVGTASEEGRRLGKESIQERRDHLRDRPERSGSEVALVAKEEAPSGSPGSDTRGRVHVKLEWRGSPEVSGTLRWRCDGGPWKEHGPYELSSVSGPFPNGGRCEVEAGGEPFAFVAVDGLRVRCGYDEPCHVVEDERPRTIAVTIPDTVRVHLTWDPKQAPIDARAASISCRDGRFEEIPASAEGGEIVLEVPRDTFCSIEAGNRSIGFDVHEDTQVVCVYGEACARTPMRRGD